MPDRINIKKQILGCRLGEVGLPHGKIETPVFMPIATRGAVKVAPFSALEEMNAQIILSNTYHLSVRPGEDLIGANGGLHKFIGWKNQFLPIVEDSKFLVSRRREKLPMRALHFGLLWMA